MAHKKMWAFWVVGKWDWFHYFGYFSSKENQLNSFSFEKKILFIVHFLF